MKRILFLVAVLFSGVLLAQTPNWTSVKETNINVSSALYFGGVDIFTNRDGNHIIVQESSNLKYYKMNLSGQASNPITIESSAVISPSISGDADNIYIVYGIGSQMKVKRSTNGGSSWSTIYALNLATNASWMESVVSNHNLHITYLESSTVKYRFRNYQSGNFTSEKIVSTGETGTYPKIAARYGGSGKDSIYFMWQKSGTNTNNWRTYEVTNNSWSSVLSGYTVSEPNLISSNLAGIRVEGPNLIAYHSFYENGTYSQRLGWAWIRISDNTLLGYLPNPCVNFVQLVYSTTTFDNISHSAYYYEQIANGEGGPQTGELAIRRSNSLTGYPDDIIYEYQDFPQYEPMFINISSAGNEVHVIWKDEFGNNNGNNLRYKFDDQAPIMPNNLQVTRSLNNHPYLTWSANPEPDFDHYIVEKAYQGGWTTLSQTTNTYFEDPNETYCTAPPPQVCDGERTVTYHVSAVDKHPYTSLPSEVKTNVTGGYPPDKAAAQISEMPGKYELGQNYPNPFNPSTSITYSLKNPEFVTLKIFDMLGREVAELVNENKPEGRYTVAFNSGDLPSGIYIYKLDAGKFSDMKKMLLIK